MSSREDADGQAMGFRNSEDFAIYLASTKESRPMAVAQPVQPAKALMPEYPIFPSPVHRGSPQDLWNADQMINYAREHGLKCMQIAAIAQPVQPAAWKSMDTAPKTGAVFLIRFPLQSFVKKLINWDKLHNCWVSYGEAVFPEHQQCEWAKIPPDEPDQSGPIIVATDADADAMNTLHGEAYGVDWVYPTSTEPTIAQPVQPAELYAPAANEAVDLLKAMGYVYKQNSAGYLHWSAPIAQPVQPTEKNKRGN